MEKWSGSIRTLVSLCCHTYKEKASKPRKEGCMVLEENVGRGRQKGRKELLAQSYPALCDPMDCSLPGSSVHGILQARILEWVAISSFRGSSRPRDQTQVSCIAGRFFTIWATKEAEEDKCNSNLKNSTRGFSLQPSGFPNWYFQYLTSAQNSWWRNEWFHRHLKWTSSEESSWLYLPASRLAPLSSISNQKRATQYTWLLKPKI